MAIHATDAIVLQKRDVRETSLLAVFYTSDYGKVRGLIKGARGPRGVPGPPAQLFTLNRIVFYDARRSGIHTVSQCDLLDYFEDIRADIEKVSYACYFIELIDALTADNDKNEEAYLLLLNSLELLKRGASPKRISRILEIKLMKISGLMPRLDKCVRCGAPMDFKRAAAEKAQFSYQSGGLVCRACSGKDESCRRLMQGTVHFIEHIARAPYEKLGMIKVSKNVGIELEDVMKDYLGYRLDRQVKSLEFLEKICKKT